MNIFGEHILRDSENLLKQRNKCLLRKEKGISALGSLWEESWKES